QWRGGVRRASVQVDRAIAVAVSGIAHQASGHELRQTHCPRKRAGHAACIQLPGVIELNQVCQLVAEQVAAFGAARIRIPETERSERIKYPKVSGVAAIDGLDANDRDDD